MDNNFFNTINIMNTAPKYSKVELLIKNKENAFESVRSTTRVEFLDAGLIITGDYIVIIKNEITPEQINTNTGTIFPLSEVTAYKTYNS